MGRKTVTIWYDAKADYLEVTFEKKEGYFSETSDDRVMEKVDVEGAVLGFSVLGVSAMRGQPPLEVALT